MVAQTTNREYAFAVTYEEQQMNMNSMLQVKFKGKLFIYPLPTIYILYPSSYTGTSYNPAVYFSTMEQFTAFNQNLVNIQNNFKITADDTVGLVCIQNSLSLVGLKNQTCWLADKISQYQDMNYFYYTLGICAASCIVCITVSVLSIFLKVHRSFVQVKDAKNKKGRNNYVVAQE